MSHLPILVPGSSQPVLVPCRLTESVTFNAYLPSRGGVRSFCMWLGHGDPLTAEVGDVTLAQPEMDPRNLFAGGPYALDEDETKRAWEAAGDVFLAILAGLGLHTSLRGPVLTNGTLEAIAKAWEAEVEAEEAGQRLVTLFRPLSAAHAAAINKHVPNLGARSGEAKSPACEAMRCYVDRVVEAACTAQADKADAQQAARGGDEDRPGYEGVPGGTFSGEVAP